MAISAVAVTTTDTLETFRVEFNNLVADVASIEQVGASNIIISDGGNIGSASDQDAIAIASTGVVTFSQTPSFTAGITVSNLDIDGATDISAAIVDADLFIVDDGASGTNRKTAASRIKTYIADVTLTTAAQTNITSVGTLTALDVDNININGNTITASTGAVNITPASGSAIVLDGTVNIDAGVVTGVTSLTSNNILIADDGTIGSASDTDAIAIAANGVVTMNQIPVFSAGINVSGGNIAGTLSTAAQTNITSLGTLTALTVYNSSTPRIEVGYNGTQNHYLGWDGSKLHFQADPQNNNAASAILFSVDGSEAMRLAAGGIATFADDIKIKNGGTIGSASDADSITIASDGQVTLSQNLTITGEVTTTGFSSTDFAAAFIVIEDGGTDGSGTDAGDNLIDETDSDDLLMENVTSWVTSGFTIRDSFGNHLQTVNGVS